MLVNLSLVIRFRFNVFAAISFIRIDEINPSTKLCVIFNLFYFTTKIVSLDGQVEQCIHEYFSSIDVFFLVTTLRLIYIFFKASSFVETINFVSTQNSFLPDSLSDQRQG